MTGRQLPPVSSGLRALGVVPLTGSFSLCSLGRCYEFSMTTLDCVHLSTVWPAHGGPKYTLYSHLTFKHALQAGTWAELAPAPAGGASGATWTREAAGTAGRSAGVGPRLPPRRLSKAGRKPLTGRGRGLGDPDAAPPPRGTGSGEGSLGEAGAAGAAGVGGAAETGRSRDGPDRLQRW